MEFDVLSPVGARVNRESIAATARQLTLQSGAHIGVLENSGRGHSIDAADVRTAIHGALGDAEFLSRRKPNRSFEADPAILAEFTNCAFVVCATAE